MDVRRTLLCYVTATQHLGESETWVRSQGSVMSIVWDFDGTLMDTAAKNLCVLRKVIPAATGRSLSSFSTLESQKAYSEAVACSAGWQELYADHLRLNADEIRRAGALWAEAYESDASRPAPIPGIPEALGRLQRFPQAVVSSNSVGVITRALEGAGLIRHFRFVLGAQDLPKDKQKPNPHMLLVAIERLTAGESGYVICIADQPSDFVMIRNANDRLRKSITVLGVVGIALGQQPTDRGASLWTARPHHWAATPNDVLSVIEGMAK